MSMSARNRRMRTALISAVAAATAVTMAMPLGLTSHAQAATGGVSAKFRLDSSWTGTYQYTVMLTNNGSTAVNNTVVDFTTPNKVNSSWDATVTATATGFRAALPSWDATLAPGETQSFGVILAVAGANNPVPSACTIAGTTCTVDGAAPTPSPTPTPTVTPTVTPTPTPTVTPTITPTPTPAPAGAIGLAPFIDMGLNLTARETLLNTYKATGDKYMNLAFVTADTANGCSPAWGGYGPYAIGGSSDNKAEVDEFKAAGGKPIISFGGATGTELAAVCPDATSLAAAYQTVVDRFGVDHIDFDIEGGAVSDSATNKRRVEAVRIMRAAEAAKGNTVAVDLTLPVMPEGLDAGALRTISEFTAGGVPVSVVNLMAMDYGSAYTQMGTLAIQAANSVATQLGQIAPWSAMTQAKRLQSIGITPMIGQNDVASEIFTVADATTVGAFAKNNSLAMIGWWSANRDHPCTTYTELWACTKLTDPKWAFANAFSAAYNGTTPTPAPTNTATPTPTNTATPTPTNTATPTPTNTTTPGGSALTVAVKVTSDWGSGRNVDITVTNSGSQALNGWNVSMPWAASSASLWNTGSASLSGGKLTFTNASWNGALAPGASAVIGGTDTGAYTAPSSCLSTVGSCAIQGSTPTPTPTNTASPTPTNTASPTPTNTASPTPSPTQTGSPFTGSHEVITYYPAWATYARNYQIADIPADKVTTINYAFANIAGGQCILGDAYADTDKAFPGDTWNDGAKRGNFNQLNKLKAAHPGLKTMISIGGWTWSDNFPTVAASDASRKTFVTSCVKFMKDWGFDGIDLDWEYPQGGGLAAGTPADKANYTLLLNEFRNQLNAQGTLDGGKHYRLSIAAPAGPDIIDHLEVAKIGQYLDTLNLMSYDYHGSWDPTTGHNAPLASGPKDTTPGFNMSDSVAGYTSKGFPAAKLILGVPFYGRSWGSVGASANGLYQPGKPALIGTWDKTDVLDYTDIVKNYLPSMQRYWDADAKVPYLYNSSTGLWISYDDSESMKAKMDFIKAKGLGGAMSWEISGDRDQELVNVIANEMK